MGIVDGFLGVREQCPHLFLRLHIVLAALVTHTVLIRHLLAGLDTQQNVVSCRILCQNVMNIVGCHQIHGKLPAHAHQALVYHFLGGNSVVLQLQKEVAFSKDLFIMPCRPAGLLVHAPGQIALHLARQAGTEGNDALMVGFQHLIIHTGLIIKAVHKSLGHDFHKVVVSGIIFRQQNQMIVAVLAIGVFPFKAGTGRHINLAADDGLDAHFPCRTVKVNDAIHNAMVGDGHAVHAKLFGPRRQLFDLTGTVQQTVLCMDVQMCKCHCLLLYILIKTGRKYHFHPAASDK